MATILHVDDEQPVQLLLEDTLSRVGHRYIGASTVAEALQALAREHVDLVVSDYNLLGLAGPEFLTLLHHEGHRVPVVVLTADTSVKHAVAAFKAGVIDYLVKPVTAEQVELAVEQALELAQSRRENEALRQQLSSLRSERSSVGNGAPTGTSSSTLPPNTIVLSSLNIDEAEAVLIQHALQAAKGNRTRTAQLLGISVRTLRNKLNGPGRIELAQRAS